MSKNKFEKILVGKFLFVPTKLDKDGNVFCAVYKKSPQYVRCNRKCKVTGLYKPHENVFEVIFSVTRWLEDEQHRELFTVMVAGYEWSSIGKFPVFTEPLIIVKKDA